VEANGNILVADEGEDGRLIRVDPTTGVQTIVSHGGSFVDPIGVAVFPAPNSVPTAADDAYSTPEDTPLTEAAPGVLGNDTDPDGDPLTAALESGPSHGTVTLNADGSFDYTSDADFNSTDTFTYKANDGTADSNIATVTITVIPVNDAPTVTVAAGGACGANQRSGTINLTMADVDDPPAGLTLSVSSSNTALVPNANVVFGGSGANRTLSATAVSGRTGTATLTVTVSDGDAEGTVPVTVKAAGNGNNTVTGTGGADMLFGQNGNDAVRGLGANDLLCGGHGNDTLTGGPGADHFGGGPGTDTATDFNAGEGDSTDGT
jgi:VCBS repeat-containing protein